MTDKRKIAVVTGTRAEYGILYPVLKAIQADARLELKLVVAGMHLAHEFGYTIREIERDGFKIDAKVEMHPVDDTPAAMAKSVGTGMLGMASAWEQLKPDIILVLGDRTEPLAATISGAYMNIPVAHVHGGDICGTIDDAARQAITTFAHIHLPATRRSAARIIAGGEDKGRVYTVGSPALDSILNEPLFPEPELAEKLGINLAKPLILAVQHPVTSQVEEAAAQMRITLEAVKEMGYATVVIYPNSDAGGRRMIGVIKKYGKHPSIKAFPSLAHREYLSLMKIASAMVGNSSSGLVEAPSFGLPAVNIGIRQEGRERGRNIIDVKHDKTEIIAAIKKALTDKQFLAEVKKCQNPYGDGKASRRIADTLAEIKITPELIRKNVIC